MNVVRFGLSLFSAWAGALIVSGTWIRWSGEHELGGTCFAAAFVAIFCALMALSLRRDG